MALYFNTTMQDPMQYATAQNSLPTTTSTILPWPSMSPDCNPNKQTWNELERLVRGRLNTPANVCELSQVLKKGWVAILAQVIHNLIQPMPERCWAVIDSPGGHPHF